ncbi:hypothetical protein GDO86_008713 [Hymenochirus boettgeri]|uniref:Uncharacterized protein n=1 Tax=Hymenochirus boettgeri TaxID=247094 RepID=A0A8T2J370_9PIPI|nr:hypothetical protein GDO86_008713 [Hymenochirus boettgeri]
MVSLLLLFCLYIEGRRYTWPNKLYIWYDSICFNICFNIEGIPLYSPILVNDFSGVDMFTNGTSWMSTRIASLLFKPCSFFKLLLLNWEIRGAIFLYFRK